MTFAEMLTLLQPAYAILGQGVFSEIVAICDCSNPTQSIPGVLKTLNVYNMHITHKRPLGLHKQYVTAQSNMPRNFSLENAPQIGACDVQTVALVLALLLRHSMSS